MRNLVRDGLANTTTFNPYQDQSVTPGGLDVFDVAPQRGHAVVIDRRGGIAWPIL